MSDKTINYIGMGLGILVTIVIVCLSGMYGSSVLSMGDRHTYYDFLRKFGGIYFAREYTDMFRVLLFGIGFLFQFGCSDASNSRFWRSADALSKFPKSLPLLSFISLLILLKI